MTTVKLSDKAAAGEVLVIGISRSETTKKLQIESGSTAVNEKEILRALDSVGASASFDEVIKLPFDSGLIVSTGLGKSAKTYPHETLRRAAGAAARELMGNKNAAFSFPYSTSADLGAIAEGAALGAYDFVEFRSASKLDRKEKLSSITVISKLSKDTVVKKLAARAELIAEYT